MTTDQDNGRAVRESCSVRAQRSLPRVLPQTGIDADEGKAIGVGHHVVGSPILDVHVGRTFEVLLQTSKQVAIRVDAK